jgi:hypothetical protein
MPPVAEVLTSEPTAQKPGRRISLSELAAEESQAMPTPPAAQAEPPSRLDNDLDALRQTVEPPQRKGLFGRKK